MLLLRDATEEDEVKTMYEAADIRQKRIESFRAAIGSLGTGSILVPNEGNMGPTKPHRAVCKFSSAMTKAKRITCIQLPALYYSSLVPLLFGQSGSKSAFELLLLHMMITVSQSGRMMWSIVVQQSLFAFELLHLGRHRCSWTPCWITYILGWSEPLV